MVFNKNRKGLVLIVIALVVSIVIYMMKVFKKGVKKSTEDLLSSGVESVDEIYLSERNLSRLAGVHPDLLLIANELSKRGEWTFNVGRKGGLRTADEQNLLYLDGKSQRDGYTLLSNHQLGFAMDLYPVSGGVVLWGSYLEFTDSIKDIANELNIEISCGIDWVSFVDKPHIELKF